MRLEDLRPRVRRHPEVNALDAGFSPGAARSAPDCGSGRGVYEPNCMSRYVAFAAAALGWLHDLLHPPQPKGPRQ